MTRNFCIFLINDWNDAVFGKIYIKYALVSWQNNGIENAHTVEEYLQVYACLTTA